MSAQLLIAKRFHEVHGKTKPIIAVRAHIDATATAFLLEHFHSETLFKRTAYANGFSDGGLQASPSLSRMLSSFVKNDACPEITVKTLLAGQKYEGTGLWELQCFEFIAKRSFDALIELVAATQGFGSTQIYLGCGVSADEAAFIADTTLELAAAPLAVTIGDVEGVANAA
jgi:hypothetical protein